MASLLPTAIKTGATSPAKRLLWSFAAALLILTWAGTIFKIRSEEAQEIASVLRTNQNLARTLEEHTLRTLKSVDQAVLFLKFQYEKNRGKINIADYVREGMIISNIFNQLGVIDAHGQYILSNLPEHKVVDLSDREHFRVHMGRDSNQLYISKPVLGRASGKWSIQMTRRINNPDGSFGGVVVVSLDPYYFTQLYGDVELGSHGVISLIGLDGVPFGTVKVLSEEWWQMVEHAIREGKRVGVNIGLFNCPGWSQSGGPWVKPTEAMRYLVSGETVIEGGRSVVQRLERPHEIFQDVKVLAYPVPEADQETIGRLNPKNARSSLRAASAKTLFASKIADSVIEGAAAAGELPASSMSRRTCSIARPRLPRQQASCVAAVPVGQLGGQAGGVLGTCEQRLFEEPHHP